MSYSAAVLADTPLVYWRLGDASGTTAADASGNSRPGTYNGSPTLGVAGALSGDSDTAITLNGTSQYATIAAAAWQNVTDYSIEFWFKSTSTSLSACVACRDSVGALGTKIWDVFFDTVTGDGKLQFITFNGSTGQNVFTTAGGWNDGNWHHCAIVKSGTTITIYMDGSSAGSGTFSTFNTSSTINLDLGRRGNNTDFFPGSLDEFAFYGSALSSARVAAHYVAGTPKFIAPGGIASGAAVGSPTVATGPVTVAPPGIASTAAVGSPLVTMGAILPAGIPSTAAVGSPTISTGPVTVAPGGIASASAVGSPTVALTTVIAPTGIASAEAVGSPTVALGPVTISPGGIASGEAVGSPTVADASAGGLIDGGTTETLAALASITVQSDGTQWWIVARSS